MKENKTALFDVRTLLFLDIVIMVFMLISGKPEVTLCSFIVAAAVPVITGLYGALVCYAILFAVFFSYYQLIFHLKLPVFHSAVFSVIGILAFIVQRIIPFMLLGTVIQKQKNISRKVDRFTKYDKDYIWQLVYDQLLKEKFSNTTAEFAMSRFEERYLSALENMRFVRSAEAVAENVFNGIFSDFNQDMRKQHSI